MKKKKVCRCSQVQSILSVFLKTDRESFIESKILSVIKKVVIAFAELH